MAEITDAEFEAATARGDEILRTQPHAASARYDRRSGRMVVELTNGCTFAFPPELVQGLDKATPEQLEAVETSGGGFGLHWEALDADYTVPGLMAGIFGTRRWMASQAGRTRSPAKAAAARANGTKGGRPRKIAGR